VADWNHLGTACLFYIEKQEGGSRIFDIYTPCYKKAKNICGLSFSVVRSLPARQPWGYGWPFP